MICVVFTLNHESFDSVLEDFRIEVDKQAGAQSAQFQVGQNLCLVQRQKSLNCLQFNQKRAFHYQVDPVTALDLFALNITGMGTCRWSASPWLINS
jgi:hypothetical protein